MPSSKVGTLNATARQYFREASIAKDALLIFKQQSPDIVGGIIREKIMVPQALLDGILYHLHNTMSQHPSKAQFKAQFHCFYML